MNAVDREGTFRAQITEYGVKEMDSGSVAVSIVAKLLEWWDGEQWHPWESYEQEASGDVWVVKKTGDLNDRQIEALVKHTNWDGELTSVSQRTWIPCACQVTIREEEFNKNKYMKINFLDAYDRTPGSIKSAASPEKVAELQNRFGSQLRALTGSMKRNAAPAPNTAPKAPPPPAKKPDPFAAGVNANGDSVPF